jgi:nucleoside-diphosphate-sugar epimerase
MRVLVTGSSGFIGRHMVAKLSAEGHWVAGLDKRAQHLAQFENVHLHCDLLDSNKLTRSVQEISPEAVIHLAARTDLEETRHLSGYAANIDGVRNLITSIASTPSIRRCIYTSSQLVCQVGYTARHETDYCPTTLYGESKVRTEQIVRETDGGIGEWCLARPTTVWGPGMNAHYRRFFEMIEAGRYFHIGNKPLYKSYSYVGNIVSEYTKLLAAPKEQITRRTFYLADYTPIDLIAWADSFQQALGAPSIGHIPRSTARALAILGDAVNALGFRGFPFNSFRLRNILTEYQVDLTATEAVCGVLPFSLEEGVQATAQWIREFKMESTNAAAEVA